MQVAHPPIEFPLYVDSSMLSTFRACKRKHFWSSLRRLYPRGQSVHLIAGGAFASGIEAARNLCFKYPVPAHAPVDALLHVAYRAFVLAWGDYEPPERGTKTFETTWLALEHFIINWHPGQDDVQPWLRPDGSPAVEYKFAIPLDDLLHPVSREPILFAGRFDMVGLLTSAANLPAVVDEKTTGSLGFDWASKWDLRGQFMGYIWALQAQGFQINHAVINGIAILKTKNEVQRAIVNFPQFMIERWERQMRRDIADMLQRWEHYHRYGSTEDSYPYVFADACESYGGCAFATLCGASEPEAFTTNYIHHLYNPLEVTPVKETSA